jgi:hypothetical protein
MRLEKHTTAVRLHKPRCLDLGVLGFCSDHGRGLRRENQGTCALPAASEQRCQGPSEPDEDKAPAAGAPAECRNGRCMLSPESREVRLSLSDLGMLPVSSPETFR